MGNDDSHERVGNESTFSAISHAKEPGDVFDLGRGSRRQRPLVEPVGTSQHRFPVSPQYVGRIEGGIERNSQHREPFAQIRLIQLPAHALQVLDHERAEIRQRAPCIDEGDDEDSAGEGSQSGWPAVLIE